MNHQALRRVVMLILLTSLVIALAGYPKPARAGVWGPIQLLETSCSRAVVRFYYDGLNNLSPWNPAYPKPDQFRAQVWNRTCASGNCNFRLGEAWQAIPRTFGYVTMTLTWAPVIPTGNGIEIIIGQYNVNNNPPTIVDRDFEGIELHTTYTCTGGTASSTTSGTPSGYAPPGFLFYCTGSGIGVSNAGVAVLQASFGQIAGPLRTATSTAKNQLITSSGGVSLWALRSNELQVHYDRNPDATKLIVRSDICGSVATLAAAQGTTGTQTYYPTQPTAGRTTYVVQPGDNLFRIALRFGRTMDAIAAANGITNYARIYVGQVLIIP